MDNDPDGLSIAYITKNDPWLTPEQCAFLHHMEEELINYRDIVRFRKCDKPTMLDTSNPQAHGYVNQD